MNRVSEINVKNSERGGAGVKLLAIAVVLALIGHAGFNYLLTAYYAENFKQEMMTAIVKGVTMPSTFGKPPEIVRSKITQAASVNDIPTDMFIDIKEVNKVLTTRVYYVKKVPILPFGLYDYNYVFDYTATPNGYILQ